MMIFFCLLYILPLTLGKNHCCPFKEVLNGSSKEVYDFKELIPGTADKNCMDGCVYTRDGGDYCFSSDPTYQVECIDGDMGVCRPPRNFTGPDWNDFSIAALSHYDDSILHLTCPNSPESTLFEFKTNHSKCSFAQWDYCSHRHHFAMKYCQKKFPEEVDFLKCLEEHFDTFQPSCIQCNERAITALEKIQAITDTGVDPETEIKYLKLMVSKNIDESIANLSCDHPLDSNLEQFQLANEKCGFALGLECAYQLHRAVTSCIQLPDICVIPCIEQFPGVIEKCWPCIEKAICLFEENCPTIL